MPEVTGEVSQVCGDAFVDEITGDRLYSTEIVMAGDQAGRLGSCVPVPGMPVEAFGRTEDRTPLTYLLEPSTTYVSRAFWES